MKTYYMPPSSPKLIARAIDWFFSLYMDKLICLLKYTSINIFHCKPDPNLVLKHNVRFLRIMHPPHREFEVKQAIMWAFCDARAMIMITFDNEQDYKDNYDKKKAEVMYGVKVHHVFPVYM